MNGVLIVHPVGAWKIRRTRFTRPRQPCSSGDVGLKALAVIARLLGAPRHAHRGFDDMMRFVLDTPPGSKTPSREPTASWSGRTSEPITRTTSLEPACTTG